MKLKQVEILGFKSFAEKTVIEFHEGITCIVGPNGCGKSNIGDAIRWVLGEQSAKALRGGKMPDVIFAGAASKKPLNFAEVTITFSDIQGALPVDFEEVGITRRLHRSGESEYFINKQPVRLKDVHSLFLDSGVGKNNFSFFEQGKIDQLIHYSPEERRYIFEEAAGIVRFLQRKRETLHKLEDVSLNLSRVADIKEEIDRQILILEEQAEAAAVYKDKKSQLETYEKELLALRYQAFAKKQKDLDLKENEVRGRHRELLGTKEALEQTLNKKKETHEGLEASYREVRDALLTKNSEKELKAQLELHSRDRIKELGTSSSKIERELEYLEGQRTGWLSEITLLKEKKEVLAADLNADSLAIGAKKQEFNALEKELSTLQKKQTEAYRDKVQAYQKQTSLQSEVKQIVYRLETHLEKKEHLEARGKQLAQLILEKEQDVQSKKEALHQVEKLVKEADQKFSESESQLYRASDMVKKMKASLEAMMREFHEKSAKLKALIHLRQEFAGFTGDGKKLLQAAEDTKNPLFGLLKGLYEFIIPEKGYEKVISTVLRAYSQTLVVSTKRELAAVLAFAKGQNLTDFSLICLELIPPSPTSTFIQKDPLGNHLFRFLSVEETQGGAFNRAFLKKEPSLLPDGAYIDEKGVLFLGGPKESTVFLREAEIKALEVDIQELNRKSGEGNEQLVEALRLEKEGQQRKADADADRRKTALSLAENRFSYQRTDSDLDRLYREKRQVIEEVNSLLAVIQGLLADQQKIQATSQSADTSLDKIQKHLNGLEGALGDKIELTRAKREILQEEEKKLALLDADYRKTTHQHQLLEAKNGETERHIFRLKEDLEGSIAGKREWELRLQSSASDLAHLEGDLESIQKQVAEIEQNRLTSKLAIQADENRFKEVDKQLKEIENKLHQIGIQLAHVETGQSSVLGEIRERFQTSSLEPSLNLAQDKLEKETEHLKSFIDHNQNVNLAAIEDCAKQKERKTFLETQIEDLTAGKLELLKMIEGLDRESRQLFTTTFQQIRHNFQKNFQILFKGGEADLELLEAEDILEAGIEITAKPPGKQMRSLSLLSGGEKCLTAMALLFAIFEVKSAPFCILDEIDAPLDDSNVERFLNVVKQFIDRCQFIIVTHNKRTMALADRLYGVSMEEKGISKLLFMEFSEQTTELAGA